MCFPSGTEVENEHPVTHAPPSSAHAIAKPRIRRVPWFMPEGALYLFSEKHAFVLGSALLLCFRRRGCRRCRDAEALQDLGRANPQRLHRLEDGEDDGEDGLG